MLLRNRAIKKNKSIKNSKKKFGFFLNRFLVICFNIKNMKMICQMFDEVSYF